MSCIANGAQAINDSSWSKTGFIPALGKLETSSQRGVGKALLNFAVSHFKGKGKEGMAPNCHADNAVALGIYQRFGFVTVHVQNDPSGGAARYFMYYAFPEEKKKEKETKGTSASGSASDRTPRNGHGKPPRNGGSKDERTSRGSHRHGSGSSRTTSSARHHGKGRSRTEEVNTRGKVTVSTCLELRFSLFGRNPQFGSVETGASLFEIATHSGQPWKMICDSPSTFDRVEGSSHSNCAKIFARHASGHAQYLPLTRLPLFASSCLRWKSYRS